MSATYTGNLIAALAVPGSDAQFKTLSDLAEQNEYQVGVMSGTALHTLFKVWTDRCSYLSLTYRICRTHFPLLSQNLFYISTMRIHTLDIFCLMKWIL